MEESSECQEAPPSPVQPQSDCNLNLHSDPLVVECSGSKLKDQEKSQSRPSSGSDSFLQESGDYQWLDDGYNRELNYSVEKHHRSILAPFVEQNNFSYDDLSKHFDASLAELDMETFRTEDIPSMLAFPTIFSGNISRENCASVSGSILGTLELDSSVSPRSTSEESAEMSICKDELLFSPVKEQPLSGGNISVDSLDCSSLEEHDIVLTCQANKNNYTIVFESSGTQYTDDSDFLETADSSEGEGNQWFQHDHGQRRSHGYMVQSDLAFTTWGKLRRTKEATSYKHADKPTTSKSQSLPNLLRQSLVLKTKYLPVNTLNCVPLYDLQTSQPSHSKDSETSGSQHSVPLLQLYIRNRSSLGSEGCSISISSSQSESSGYMMTPPLYGSNFNMQGDIEKFSRSRGYLKRNSVKQCECKIPKEHSGELYKELEKSEERRMTMVHTLGSNYRTLVDDADQVTEANNNMLQISTNNNTYQTNVCEEDQEPILESDEESSQYFEDSLVEAPPPRPVAAHSSIIHEEEEPLDTDSGSGDETMKDSKEPIGSDSTTSEEITLTKNNTIKIKPKVSKQDRGAGTVQRINNFFTTSKVDNIMANKNCESTHEKCSPNWVDLTPEINSQGTQTKQLNSKRSESMQEFFTDNDKHINNARPHSPRESSPASSGYGSSRQNSVERLRQNSQLSINTTNTVTLNQSQRKKTVVTVPTLQDRVTQIPVHIKNRSVQTSFTNVSDGFMIEEATMIDKSTSSSFRGDNSTSPNLSEDTESDKKPVYVCFPNYSLPDLSFLKELRGDLDGSNLLYLKPSSPLVPPYMKDVGLSRSEKNKKSLSFPDFESVSQDTFNHVQDWDSLSVLLPNDLKPLIPKLSQSKIEEKKHETEDYKKNNYPIFHNEPCWVFSKSIKKNVSVEENTDVNGKCFSSEAGSSNDSFLDPESTDIPPPLPKRSLSLLKDNCFGDGSSSSPKGILRKSPSSDYCKEQNHQQCVSKCRNASCMFSRREDLKHKRRSLHEPCQELLENIPERSHVKGYCCFAPATCHVIDQTLTNVVCNSKEILDTKSSRKKPLQKNLSEGCCSGCPNRCQNCMSSKQSVCLYCHADSPNQLEGFQHNRFSFPRFAAFEGKQPLQQLCGQLQQLLNSSTSLNLMAAALLAAQGSPEGSNTSSTSSNCNCSRSKKAVSFCEKVAVKSRETGTTAEERTCQQNNTTTAPPCGHKSEAKHFDYKEEMDYPPEDFQVSSLQGQFSNYQDFESPLSAYDEISTKCLSQKADLVKNLAQTTDALMLDLSEGCDHKEQVLEGLCPALYAIVADGLLPTVKGLFGYVSNSPWRVAEASALSGEPPADLKELIRYVSGKENLVDNTCRFYAFILGLLNLRSLDWWFLHLTSCKTLVSRHYTSEALLSLLSFPAATSLCEELLTKLRPLASVSFTLELSVEYSVFVSEVQNISPSPQEHSTLHDTEEKNHVVHRRHAKMEQQNDVIQRQRPVSFMEKGQLKTPSHHKRQSWNGNDLTEKTLLEVLSQEASDKQNCEDTVGKQISNKMREKPPLPEKPKTLVPSRMNKEFGSKVMQKDVNIDFPSSKPTVCLLDKGNKIHKNDDEKPRPQSGTEDTVSHTVAENKDCEGKVFEQLKRRWEDLTTSNTLGTVKATTVPTVTSRRPPVPATSLSKQKSEKVQPVVPKMTHAVQGRRKSHRSPVSSPSSVSSRSSTNSPVRSSAVGSVSPSPSPDSSSLVRRATSPNMLPSQVTPPVSPSYRGRGHVNRKSFIPIHRVARTSPSPQRRPRSTGSGIPRPGEEKYH